MNGLVGEFLRRVESIERRQLNLGQLCRGPVPYLSSQIQSVTLESYVPASEHLNRYSISTHDPNDTSMFSHGPVHATGLHGDEALLVSKAKRRPVIVMSQPNSDWSLGGARLAERGFVCVPIYSYQPRDYPELRDRVESHEYPWWIHIPEFSTFREGFARLDRIQVIEERQLEPWFYALTEDALWFISEWLRYYLTEEIDPMLLDYHNELAGDLP